MLCGKSVKLRPLQRDDVDKFLTWVNDSEVTSYLTLYLPMTRMAEEAWITHIDQSSTDVVFVMETLDGDYLGNIGLHRIDKHNQNTELGIVIGNKEYWGQGLGSEAVRLIVHYAFNALNMHRVYLHVLADNIRAIECYKKCGFVQEGRLRQHQFKKGTMQDLVVMGVLRNSSY